MQYLWTEDQGAGLHLWQLANQYLFQNRLIVESKKSNQGILDAVRCLTPAKTDTYYLAFDIVYDNIDVVNKLLELKELIANYPKQIIILDMICFEYIILAFHKLTVWTKSGRKDVLEIRNYILKAIRGHQIDLDSITDEKTRHYLMGFKQYSTERVIKSITYMLTDKDAWNIKGTSLGECWHQDCCILQHPDKRQCSLDAMTGCAKISELLSDTEFQKIIRVIQ